MQSSFSYFFLILRKKQWFAFKYKNTVLWKKPKWQDITPFYKNVIRSWLPSCWSPAQVLGSARLSGPAGFWRNGFWLHPAAVSPSPSALSSWLPTCRGWSSVNNQFCSTPSFFICSSWLNSGGMKCLFTLPSAVLVFPLLVPGCFCAVPLPSAAAPAFKSKSYDSLHFISIHRLHFICWLIINNNNAVPKINFEELWIPVVHSKPPLQLVDVQNLHVGLTPPAWWDKTFIHIICCIFSDYRLWSVQLYIHLVN